MMRYIAKIVFVFLSSIAVIVDAKEKKITPTLTKGSYIAKIVLVIIFPIAIPAERFSP